MRKSTTPSINKTEINQLSSDVKYIKIGNTTYEVVSNYVGTQSLLDIVKSAIKRDVENMLYDEFHSLSRK